ASVLKWSGFLPVRVPSSQPVYWDPGLQDGGDRMSSATPVQNIRSRPIRPDLISHEKFPAERVDESAFLAWPASQTHRTARRDRSTNHAVELTLVQSEHHRQLVAALQVPDAHRATPAPPFQNNS